VWPKENIYEKSLNIKDIQYVPTPVWNHLDNNLLQKELILPRKTETHSIHKN